MIKNDHIAEMFSASSEVDFDSYKKNILLMLLFLTFQNNVESQDSQDPSP